jgi:hypothetical protein
MAAYDGRNRVYGRSLPGVKSRVPNSSTAEISITPFRYMPYRSCRCAASPAARVVPYDSPARNFGDIQRPLRDVHSRITSPTDSRSWVNPWYSPGFSPSTAREYPVDTGSMKTTSLCCSSVSALSTSAYGGGASSPASPETTRRGPSRPRCSQMLDDPGPPLNANVTGRSAASASSSV